MSSAGWPYIPDYWTSPYPTPAEARAAGEDAFYEGRDDPSLQPCPHGRPHGDVSVSACPRCAEEGVGWRDAKYAYTPPTTGVAALTGGRQAAVAAGRPAKAPVRVGFSKGAASVMVPAGTVAVWRSMRFIEAVGSRGETLALWECRYIGRGAMQWCSVISVEYIPESAQAAMSWLPLEGAVVIDRLFGVASSP